MWMHLIVHSESKRKRSDDCECVKPRLACNTFAREGVVTSGVLVFRFNTTNASMATIDVRSPRHQLCHPHIFSQSRLPPLASPWGFLTHLPQAVQKKFSQGLHAGAEVFFHGIQHTVPSLEKWLWLKNLPTGDKTKPIWRALHGLQGTISRYDEDTCCILVQWSFDARELLGDFGFDSEMKMPAKYLWNSTVNYISISNMTSLNRPNFNHLQN